MDLTKNTKEVRKNSRKAKISAIPVKIIETAAKTVKKVITRHVDLTRAPKK